MVNTFVGLTVFVTGIANVFLVKGGKKLTDPVHKMWIHFFELKFILALLLTPLIYPITSIFAEEGQNVISSETKDKIQFYIVVFMFFYSSFTRYFREEVCHGFKKDFIMEKVNQLQKRYEDARNSEHPLPDYDEPEKDKKKTASTKVPPRPQ